jgi:hypothetical protein
MIPEAFTPEAFAEELASHPPIQTPEDFLRFEDHCIDKTEQAEIEQAKYEVRCMPSLILVLPFVAFSIP